eukprot:3205018-Amphidinium_carterae.2
MACKVSLYDSMQCHGIAHAKVMQGGGHGAQNELGTQRQRGRLHKFPRKVWSTLQTRLKCLPECQNWFITEVRLVQCRLVATNASCTWVLQSSFYPWNMELTISVQD